MPIKQPSTSKTKIAPPEEIIKQARIAKARAGARGGSLVTEGNKQQSSSKIQKKEIASDAAPNKEKSSPSKSSKKRSRSDSNAGDITTHSIPEASSDVASNDEDDEDTNLNEESEDDDGQPLIHESLLAGKSGVKAIGGNTSLQTRAKKAAKYAGETKNERDARTTFIGNVPVICATNKVSPLLTAYLSINYESYERNVG